MVKIGMKVFEYGSDDVVLSYGDTEAELDTFIKANHGSRMVFALDPDEESRFILNVADRGEECEFEVCDYGTVAGVYDGGSDQTLFAFAGIADINDGVIGYVIQMDQVDVVAAEGVFSVSAGGLVVEGDYSAYDTIGFRYIVKGDRVFLSAGAYFGSLSVQQTEGDREFELIIFKESDEV